MEKMELSQLVSLIQKNPASLFFGSGITYSSGGPTWQDLLEHLKEKFNENENGDFFEYLDNIIGFNDVKRKEVEDIIKTCLLTISPNENVKYLLSLPWKAAFTTNYDKIPEMVGKSIDENRDIISLYDSEVGIVQDRDDYLYCFKLMGDENIQYPNKGYMILTSWDLFAAAENRTKFFEYFRKISTQGIIIYIGYSFKDDLVFKLLYQMKTILKRFPYRGYAIIPCKPSEEILKRLDEIGITWVQGDLEKFISCAIDVFGLPPESVPTKNNTIKIHEVTYEISPTLINNIKNYFSIVTNEQMFSEDINILNFLKGETNSFVPYKLNYDYKRRTKKIWKNEEFIYKSYDDMFEILDNVNIDDFKNNSCNALIGVAGSGKSVAINRLAYNWYEKGNPVIFINKNCNQIEYKVIDGLMDEVRDTYYKLAKKRGILKPKSIRWLIIADFGGLGVELVKLKNHFISMGKPADIIMASRESETPLDSLKKLNFDSIYRLDDSVNESDRDSFIKHFSRFPDIVDEKIWIDNVKDRNINTSFFSLMYSTIRHSRRTIRDLIKDEYEKMETLNKKLYSYVALLQSFDVIPLLSIILNSGEFEPMWFDAEVSKGKLSGYITVSNSYRNLEVNNRVIAEIVSDIAYTINEKRILIESMIKNITMGDITEMGFIDVLLNSKIDENIGPKFDDVGKISIYNTAISKFKTRPFLIHLGRIYTHAEKFDTARKILKEAHITHDKYFVEPETHIFDAEGRVDLAEATKKYMNKDYDISELLDSAEEKLSNALINPKESRISYEALADTYILKSKISDEDEYKLMYLFKVMEICDNVQKYLGNDFLMINIKKEVEQLLKELNFSESDIDEIRDDKIKAIGYAYLADIWKSRNIKKAFDYIELGLKYNEYSIWLMRLKIELLKTQTNYNIVEVTNVLNKYAAISHDSFDIELSFELAKETYMNGDIRAARNMFRILRDASRNHTRRLRHREPIDRWFEDGKPKKFSGVIVKKPTRNKYGRIETTYPYKYKDTIVVRYEDLELPTYDEGYRVNYEIIFNMLGPEASRVRI